MEYDVVTSFNEYIQKVGLQIQVNITSKMKSGSSKGISSLSYRQVLKAIAKQRTRSVVKPFEPKPANRIQNLQIQVYDYDASNLRKTTPANIEACFAYFSSPTNTWINLEDISKPQLETLSAKFNIHWLIQEDILDAGQRPKFDEIEGTLYAILKMLYVNPQTSLIEQEQISLIFGPRYILTFQQDAEKDVFDPVRKKLQIPTSRERERGSDYLFYALIDVIVDSYLGVIENIGTQIESIEDQIITRTSRHAFEKIAQLRKDIILLKRSITPVRDLVAAIIRSDSLLFDEKTTKYFKDVNDHVVQSNDLIDNYRDLILGLQDSYVNNINLRMNEVMKTLAIVTAVMAPATVIGGIFGMNFEQIPYSSNPWGFYITILLMLLIPILMIWWFKKKGWFQKDYPG